MTRPHLVLKSAERDKSRLPLSSSSSIVGLGGRDPSASLDGRDPSASLATTGGDAEGDCSGTGGLGSIISMPESLSRSKTFGVFLIETLQPDREAAGEEAGGEEAAGEEAGKEEAAGEEAGLQLGFEGDGVGPDKLRLQAFPESLCRTAVFAGVNFDGSCSLGWPR